MSGAVMAAATGGTLPLTGSLSSSALIGSRVGAGVVSTTQNTAVPNLTGVAPFTYAHTWVSGDGSAAWITAPTSLASGGLASLIAGQDLIGNFLLTINDAAGQGPLLLPYTMHLITI